MAHPSPPIALTRGTRAVQRVLIRVQRFVVTVVRRFYGDNCLSQASALAYTSLLSLVPLCALMFAVLKGLGAQHRLEPLLLSRLALNPEVADRIVAYIDRTNVGTLGALGAAALVFTVLSVLGSVETSFNHIWRVRHGRTWWRKATDYLSTVLVTPLLLLAAVAITSSVQEQTLLRWILQTEYVGGAVVETLRLAPIIINALALMMLYSVMPNRRPYVPGIIVGAVIAGCVWQVVQWGYITLQIGVARYNAIYGALSQLPVMLVWLYVSWIVVLAGAEIAAEYEFSADATDRATETTSRWAIALQLLLEATERFRGQGGVVDLRATARQLRVEPNVIDEIADALCAAGLLALDGKHNGYLLARDPSNVSLGDLDALIDTGVPPPGCDARVLTLTQQLTAERRSAWRDRRLADLVDAVAQS